jgi:hypothetical protein
VEEAHIRLICSSILLNGLGFGIQCLSRGVRMVEIARVWDYMYICRKSTVSQSSSIVIVVNEKRISLEMVVACVSQ